MSETNPLVEAFAQLNSSVKRLDAIVDVQIKRASSLIDVEAEVQRMGADRSRLAESLDNVQQRTQQLEHANREVSRRLVDAMEKIRTVIERRT